MPSLETNEKVKEEESKEEAKFEKQNEQQDSILISKRLRQKEISDSVIPGRRKKIDLRKLIEKRSAKKTEETKIEPTFDSDGQSTLKDGESLISSPR